MCVNVLYVLVHEPGEEANKAQYIGLEEACGLKQQRNPVGETPLLGHKQ